jgi:hypothetical protein
MKITAVFGDEIIERRMDLLTITKDYFKFIFFEYEDKFGRKFKLIPVTNENIKFPFIIEPLFQEIKK